LVVLCHLCHQPMVSLETVEQTADHPRMEFLQCQNPSGCSGGRLAVIYELSGDHAPVEPGLVEREIARRGAFFPSDYNAGRRGPSRW
jgi:hypothetical protein